MCCQYHYHKIYFVDRSADICAGAILIKMYTVCIMQKSNYYGEAIAKCSINFNNVMNDISWSAKFKIYQTRIVAVGAVKFTII